jgi:hypothetical protein
MKKSLLSISFLHFFIGGLLIPLLLLYAFNFPLVGLMLFLAKTNSSMFLLKVTTYMNFVIYFFISPILFTWIGVKFSLNKLKKKNDLSDIKIIYFSTTFIFLYILFIKSIQIAFTKSNIELVFIAIDTVLFMLSFFFFSKKYIKMQFTPLEDTDKLTHVEKKKRGP